MLGSGGDGLVLCLGKSRLYLVIVLFLIFFFSFMADITVLWLMMVLLDTCMSEKLMDFAFFSGCAYPELEWTKVVGMSVT